MELSVIIPALNEANALPLLLSDLCQQQDCELEIIVADGGSTDATVALAQTAGATVVRAPRGRGVQMNAGAQQATGDCLLFLHADSRLAAPTLLRDALATLKTAMGPDKSHRVAGHFPLRFMRSEPGHDFLFRYLEGKTALNRRYTINGDQGALLPAQFFHELGGYDTRLPFLEDQRLASKVWEQGRWLVLPGELLTSARRFELEGHRPRLILMTLMMALHEAGANEFFAKAPQVYAAQDRAGKLDLFAFHRLIRGLLWRARWKRMAGILFHCGRFVRQNTWQLFYCRDLRTTSSSSIPSPYPLPQGEGERKSPSPLRGEAKKDRALLGPAERPSACRREDRGAVGVGGEAGEFRCLRFYDQYLDSLIDNRLFDFLATLLMCAWFFIWLPAMERR